MSEIQTNTFLEPHSGTIAQKHALRLCCLSHALLPSDKNMEQLIEQEIISELLELAFHGRRTMECYSNKQVIIHSRDLSVNWEPLENYKQEGCNPYKGRIPIYAGSITVVSDKGETEKLPIGAIAGAYIHFQNQVGNGQEGVSNAN